MSGLWALLFTAVVLPVILAEATDWCRWLSFRIVCWSARLLGDEKARERYAEEWTAALEEVPGKLSPLIDAVGILARVPMMRSAIRASHRRNEDGTVESDNPTENDSTVIDPDWVSVPFRPLSVSPTVQSLVLGGHLRRLREEAFITLDQAAEAIRSSHSHISRMEHGRIQFDGHEIEDLLTLYGILPGEEREALLRLARQANTPGWWQGSSDLLPHWVQPYFGLEAAASFIRVWELQFVPGLLQTEAYARAIIPLGNAISEEDVLRRAEARMTRQDILNRKNPPRLWAVIDESALRRPTGGRAVMREQIRHLIDMAEHPAVTLQVLPFQYGSRPAPGGPFTVLRFSEPDLPDVVYVEQLSGAIYLDKSPDVDSYLEAMEEFCLRAGSLAETQRLLIEILDSL